MNRPHLAELVLEPRDRALLTNDDGVYFLDMWALVPEPGEITTLAGKSLEAQVDSILEMVRRAKVELQPGRAQMPTGLPGLFVFHPLEREQAVLDALGRCPLEGTATSSDTQEHRTGTRRRGLGLSMLRRHRSMARGMARDAPSPGPPLHLWITQRARVPPSASSSRAV